MLGINEIFIVFLIGILILFLNSELNREDAKDYGYWLFVIG